MFKNIYFCREIGDHHKIISPQALPVAVLCRTSASGAGRSFVVDLDRVGVVVVVAAVARTPRVGCRSGTRIEAPVAGNTSGSGRCPSSGPSQD